MIKQRIGVVGAGGRFGVVLDGEGLALGGDTGEGRKGWKSMLGGVVVRVDEEGGDAGGEEDGDLGEDGAGLSVTLISGEPGGVSLSLLASSWKEEAAPGGGGGLAGSTTSTGRLSRLIMALRFLFTWMPY